MTRVKRSTGQSAMACAAYRAGEKLHSDYYGEDSDFTRKGGVKFTEILLPSHAPPEYANRQTLWNAVEKIEKHPKAQLAYSFDIALQNELSYEENKALARKFCQQSFVDHGMIVDLAIHDPDKDGGIQNPHFHVLCSMRPLKNDGEWDAKQHRVYELDEGGNRIRDADGEYVFTSANTTDWDDPDTLRRWREEWAQLVNAKFEEKGLDCRIDQRTLEQQGIDALPTIHEGPSVRAMEKKGIQTDVGSFNRMIKSGNSFARRIKAAIARLCKIIAGLKQEQAQLRQPTLSAYLGAYYQVRNEYATQNFGYGATKAKTKNLQQYAQEYNYLQERNINTVEELDSFTAAASAKNSQLADGIRTKTGRIRELNELLRHAGNLNRYQPLADELNKIKYDGKREKFKVAHESELTQLYMAKRVLKGKCPDGQIKTKAWRAEVDRLTAACASEQAQQREAYQEMKMLIKIATHVQDGQKQFRTDRSIDKQREPERE